MNESKISVRYAKALFLLGKEKNVLDTVVADMKLVGELCNTVMDFWLMVESPVIKTSQKRKAVKLVLADKLDAISLGFIDMVFENRREIFIKDMVRNFLDLCRKDKGVVSAKLTTAGQIDGDDKTNLSEMLKKAFNSKIELEEVLDKDIIGGFILRVDDQELDASVSNQLYQIKRALM
ncbi:ATP synthase F1 subunit delta [Ancylomarina euxinus]|uniref:ATP synthase subunit delta n=1 Tax=Ancylomarina euxinus TaxID=2283627 RepID=A0A425Y7T6_9BACT|nr:ATP synthase F1 subunit delta [Ancylomarina euxinus]MCZ4693556.1 ATP synthase F1 subunit delta [Ancylomarina euxinus]MUP13783.1 ATP synthase F1 subunit delta [Ancylomarina euxinus]RRG24581.1 ATP synthase F1 subunit delta [Ancylomarina euxinus]